MESQNYENNMDSILARIRKSKMESDRKVKVSFDKYYAKNNSFKENVKKYNSFCGGVPIRYNEFDDSISIESTDSHSLIIGSTGSKKSRLVIMPTVKILAAANESMIISDPKAEIYERTAYELNQLNYNIYIVNLRNPSLGNAWNPLYIPYKMYSYGDVDKAYEFVNDISINLMLADVSTKDPYWDYSAKDLFFGLVLLLFKYCKEHNEPKEKVNIRNLIKLRNDMFKKADGSIDSKFKSYIKNDEIIYSSLNGTISVAEKTQACILSTFDEKMQVFMIQPNLLNMLSYNDIHIDDVGNKKSAIYLIMPDEKTSYHKLVTLFVKQSYEYLIFKAQSLNQSSMPIRVNYILDEFSSLPTMKDFPAMITAARSRNIRFNLVIQSKNQLIKRYCEETETIFTNCTNWIFLNSRELSLLEEISKLCGSNYANGKYIIPAAALQHLDKKRGEALIINGRLYPFFSLLKDISYYDGNKFKRLDISARNYLPTKLIEYNFVRVKDDYNDNYPISSITNDFESELEKKYKELFGNSDE